MNEQETYNQQLLKFADYLDGINQHPEHGLTNEIELVDLDYKKRTHYKVMYSPWVFDELVSVFEEWYFSEFTGGALFEGCDTENNTATAVIEYFGLSLEEFCHLFDIENGGLQQCELYGGTKLTLESQGSEIARNIVELVQRKRQSE